MRRSVCRVFGFDAVALVEAVDTSCRIDELLLTRIERMARRTDFHADVLSRRSRFDDVSARARDLCQFVFGVNSFFHNRSLYYAFHFARLRGTGLRAEHSHKTTILY